jgi:hypothetical protein
MVYLPGTAHALPISQVSPGVRGCPDLEPEQEIAELSIIRDSTLINRHGNSPMAGLWFYGAVAGEAHSAQNLAKRKRSFAPVEQKTILCGGGVIAAS